MTYNPAAWAVCLAAAWETVAAEARAQPLTPDAPYLMLADALARITHAEARQENLARDLLGQRDDHIVVHGARYARAYIEATMHEFNWTLMDEPDTYPWAFVQKWPDLRAHAEAHLADVTRRQNRQQGMQEAALEEDRERLLQSMQCPPAVLTERERRLQQLWKAWGFPVHPDTPAPERSPA